MPDMITDRSPYPMQHGLSALVHDVARLRRKLLDGALRPVGLTRAQRWMLIQLSQYAEARISQAELAQKMAVGPVSLGEKLQLLEGLGYVARTRSRTDRRQNILQLTDNGFEALHHSTELTQSFNARALAGLKGDELAAAERVLAAIHANLMELDDEQRNAPPI